MSTIEQQIIETWQIHNRITLSMIKEIPDEAFSATLSTRGGRDISRQLAHVHNIRVGQLGSFGKKIGTPVKEFDKGESPHKQKLLDAFEATGSVMEKYIEQSFANEGKVSNFKKGVVQMLGYYISHEAHHRGSILLTMKQSGFSLPDALKWGIWDWNKI